MKGSKRNLSFLVFLFQPMALACIANESSNNGPCSSVLSSTELTESVDEGSVFSMDSVHVEKVESASLHVDVPVKSPPPCSNDALQENGHQGELDASAKACSDLTAYIAQIQKALLIVNQNIPPKTSTSRVRNMLAYILHAKWQWSVKFCLRSSPQQSATFKPWLEDVLVVCPSKEVQFIVDLDFRSKFMVRNASYCSETLRTIPGVFMGSLQQLLIDLDTWTAPFADVFAGKHHPPWRSKSLFTNMYEACAKCDATPSYVCLRNINLQLAQGGQAVNGTDSALEPCYVDCLLTILGPVEPDTSLQRLAAPSWSMGDGTDSYFEKEDCHTAVPVPCRSGLSLLMERVQETISPVFATGGQKADPPRC